MLLKLAVRWRVLDLAFRLRERPAKAWAVAALIVTAGLLLRTALDPLLEARYPYLPVLCTTVPAALFAGRAAGVTALAAAVAACLFLFVAPRWSWGVADPEEWFVPGLLFAVSYLVQELVHSVLRQAGALSTLAQQRQILIRELAHRTKGNLQLVSAYLMLRRSKIGDPHCRAAFDQVADRVGLVGWLHDELYARGGSYSLDAGAFLESLAARLRTLVLDSRPIALLAQVVPAKIGLDEAVPLGLLVHELVSSAAEHAFPEERGGAVEIDLHWHDDGVLRLCVMDDGVGMPNPIQPGLGMRTCRALAYQLGGEIEWRRRVCGGVAATLIFPVPEFRHPDVAFELL